MADTSSFESMIKAVSSFPHGWDPRRIQPEWDRDFNGRADIVANFNGRTDKAHTWLAFCLQFSEVIQMGFRGPEDTDDSNLKSFAAIARKHAANGKNQFKD